MPNSNPSVWETWVSRDCWGQYHGTPTHEAREDFAIRLGDEIGALLLQWSLPLSKCFSVLHSSGKKTSIFPQKEIKSAFPLMLWSNRIVQQYPYKHWRRNIHNSQEGNIQQRAQYFDQNVIIEILYSQLSSESLSKWEKKNRYKPKINHFAVQRSLPENFVLKNNTKNPPKHRKIKLKKRMHVKNQN